MTLKFCFQDEIHRCSEPSETLEDLKNLLRYIFKLTLPKEYSLTYMTPDDEIISLNTEEEYSKLKTLQFSKPVKVFIHEKLPEMIEEPQIKDVEEIDLEDGEGSNNSHIEVMSLSVEDSEKKSESYEVEIKSEHSFIREEDLERSMDKLIDKISQKCESNLSQLGDAPQEVQVKDVVRQTIQEEMTSIVASVKEALLKEGFIQRPNPPQPLQPIYYHPYQQNLYQPPNNPYHYYPYMAPSQMAYSSMQRPMQYPQSFPQQVQAQTQPQVQQQVPGRSQSFSHPQEYSQQRRVQQQQIPEPDFLDKFMNMIVELPGKAVDFVDGIARKIEGDPVVVCNEGRYPKSVVEKVNFMKEIFKEADRKELLDFVERFPREMSLNQIAEIWIAQKYKLGESQNTNLNTNTK